MSNSRRYTDNDGIEHQEFESENYQRDLLLAAADKQQPKSCLRCNHFKVCTIARNIFPMMEQMFGNLEKKDQPFQADQIAWLCKDYELKKPQPQQEQPNVEHNI